MFLCTQQQSPLNVLNTHLKSTQVYLTVPRESLNGTGRRKKFQHQDVPSWLIRKVIHLMHFKWIPLKILGDTPLLVIRDQPLCGVPDKHQSPDVKRCVQKHIRDKENVNLSYLGKNICFLISITSVNWFNIPVQQACMCKHTNKY